jgi:hypothetical protein
MYFVLLGFYVTYISGNPDISRATRITLGIGLIGLPIIAIPAYVVGMY